MKKYLSLLLVLALLLPGCGKKDKGATGQDAETIAKVMLDSLAEHQEADDLTWYLEPGDVDSYITDYYKLEDLNWLDGAIVRMEGSRAFELAVLFLDEWDVEGAVGALQEYLLDRKASFTGYFPDQAALIDSALVLSKKQCAALIICEDPDAAQTAFESCFDDGANAVGIPAILGTDEEGLRPDGRLIYKDPGKDDMTLFDNSAILAAWKNGDSSSLSREDKQVLDAAERVFEFLDEEEELPDPAVPEGDSTPRRGPGRVDFQRVSFGYSPDRILMKDLSLSIRPGETVAIVGPTGAGKTTLVNLILRFYEVSGGRILLDGEDIAGMSRTALRSRIGMVLQDTWLFSGTIRENIRYGRLDATDAEVEEAARSARADKFILPQGYDTQLGEDAANISQGQRQLLTIARAILSDPDILILDEATSSVDTRTEVLIQKAMNTLMKGRTSFVIAHRLSTIRDASKILVMRDGDIIETGSHRELMAQGGFYAQLYQSQFKGEAETP